MTAKALSFPENRSEIVSIAKGLQPATILDVGFGSGAYGPLLKEAIPDVWIDGLDVCEAYRNRLWQHYDGLALCNALSERGRRYLTCGLYDLYLMVDVIEHWPKDEALAVLAELSAPALISTPHDYPQGPAPENPWQAHVSQWTVDDFAGFDHTDYSNERSVIVVIRP